MLEALFLSGQEDKIVSVGYYRDRNGMVSGGTTPAGFGGSLDFPKDQFQGQVEEDGAHWAALFNTGVDWDGVGDPCVRADFGGGVGVSVADHVDQIRWEAHVRQGGEDGVVRDAAEGVAEVQPSYKHILLGAARITNYRLEKETMFVAPFCRSCTFLLLGEQSIFYGPLRYPSC